MHVISLLFCAMIRLTFQSLTKSVCACLYGSLVHVGHYAWEIVHSVDHSNIIYAILPRSNLNLPGIWNLNLFCLIQIYTHNCFIFLALSLKANFNVNRVSWVSQQCLLDVLSCSFSLIMTLRPANYTRLSSALRLLPDLVAEYLWRLFLPFSTLVLNPKAARESHLFQRLLYFGKIRLFWRPLSRFRFHFLQSQIIVRILMPLIFNLG